MFCGGRGKSGNLVENNKNPWQRNIVVIFCDDFFLKEEKMKSREVKITVKLFLFFFKFPFLGLYNLKKKTQYIIFRCMVIPLGPHSVYT